MKFYTQRSHTYILELESKKKKMESKNIVANNETNLRIHILMRFPYNFVKSE